MFVYRRVNAISGKDWQSLTAAAALYRETMPGLWKAGERSHEMAGGGYSWPQAAI